MKRHLNILIAIIVLMGGLAISAEAQTSSTQRVLANIPFEFNVGKTKLPAGKYEIAVVNPASDRKILQIRSTDGRFTAATLTTNTNGNASDDAKLVFHRYGDTYFFAQAQMAGDSVGLAALKSSVEREQRQALAKAGTKKAVVIVAAE
jgi:hypothetical protein